MTDEEDKDDETEGQHDDDGDQEESSTSLVSFHLSGNLLPGQYLLQPPGQKICRSIPIPKIINTLSILSLLFSVVQVLLGPR